MRSLSTLAALGLAASLVLPTGGEAAVVAGTLDFIVSGFQAADPSAPQDTLTGTVNIQFDNAVSATNQTVGVSIVALNFSPASPLAFNYNPVSDILTIGGLASGAGFLSGLGNDFFVSVQNLFNGFPIHVSGAYIIPPDAFSVVDGGSATFTVPEPATMTLLGAGLLGLAAVRRRRR